MTRAVDPADQKTAAFSRSGSTSPFGKLDDRIEAFRIESAVKAAFAKRAAEAGKPEAEFLRDVIRVVAWGPEAVKRLREQEVDLVVQKLGGKLR